MSQIAAKHPLEKMQTSLLMRMTAVTLLLLRCKAWARRVWAAMINETAYHARRPLLSDDSLICQSALAMALGGSDRAMIVQKLHEWIEYNRSEGHTDKKRDGVWWTYNSYADWSKTHFGWLSDDAIGRHVRALETLGVIRTRQMKKRDRSKWYTIEYGKLNALLRDAKVTAAMNLHHAKTHSHRADLNSHHANSHDDSSSKAIKKSKVVTQEKTTPPQPAAATRLEPLASTENSKEAKGQTDRAEPISQSMAMDDSDFGCTTPPSSATPPIDAKAAKVWAMAHNQMCHLLGKTDPALRIKESVLRDFTRIDGCGVYRVTVPSQHAQDLLQHRYYRNVERIFTGVSDQPVRIEFEVGI